MSGHHIMILYALILSGLFRVSTASGHIEVHFVRYSDTCTEIWSACDPQFSFCLSTPQTGSLSVDNCNYASTGPSSSHFHNTNNIDMEHLTNIKGHPNPWIVAVPRFLGRLVMLVVKVSDVDVWGTDEMQTWATVLNETIWAGLEQAVWEERVMTQNSYTMRFRVRMYCDANFYTTSCDVMCVADNSSSGHYVCEEGSGRKVCLPGWQGLQCAEDVDECALSFCHSGECSNLPGDYICSCPVNYTGSFHIYSPNGTDYNCTCQYPFSGERCQVSDPSVWTTIHTSVETVSTSRSTEAAFTSTVTSSTSTVTSSSSTLTSSTLNTSKSAPELSSLTTASAKEPRLSEWTKSTTSGKSVANVELVKQKEEANHFQPWYVAVIVGVVFIAIVVVLVVVIRKRRSRSKLNVCPPSVSFNGTNVMFQNGVYADANRSSTQTESQSRELPAVPPAATTPTEDDRFNPAKTPSFVEADDLGAAGSRTTDQTEPKKKSASLDTSALNVRPASGRAESNLYADFQSLKDGQKPPQTLGTHGDNHYDGLHEETGAVPHDPETEYSDLTFNFDPQSAPVVTTPASPYDVPSNNSSYYSTPPTRSPMLQPEPVDPDPGTLLRGSEEIDFSNPVLDGDFNARTQVKSADSDSSQDEDSVQEDIARLRQEVEDNMSTSTR